VKVLVDVNLSPAWVAVLAAHRIEAVHWTSVGDPRAADAELMCYARDLVEQATLIFRVSVEVPACARGRRSRRRGDSSEPSAPGALR
jgi:hypothetical protein